VNRHVHANNLIFNNALKVEVHDARFRGVALHVLDDRGLAFFANLDVQDTRVERLVRELVQDLVVVKCQCARRTAGAIDDCGYFVLVTQAAARTFP
jgi:hypothetical protein